MKEIKRYVCEVCKTEYEEMASAKRCENNHKHCVKISNEVYLPITVDESGYPSNIEVEMETGDKVIFNRSRI